MVYAKNLQSFDLFIQAILQGLQPKQVVGILEELSDQKQSVYFSGVRIKDYVTGRWTLYQNIELAIYMTAELSFKRLFLAIHAGF